jgi:hypothetical protein
MKIRYLENSYFASKYLIALALVFGFYSTVFAEIEGGGSEKLRASVGEVSLVLGKAYRIGAERQDEMEVGAPVYVGDLVFTESGGHIHIRFVDDALVSVRPSSTLKIDRYDFDRKFPKNSTVKFTLIEGVTRAISGQAAKSARERFRLNTPIAAIGVRGTDFVVKANARSTQALVNEGVIVMAPFSSQCTSEALGPCDLNAVELAGNSRQVIELNRVMPLPQLSREDSPRRFGDLQGRFGLASAGNVRVGEATDQGDANSVVLESVALDQASAANAIGSDSVMGASLKGSLPDYTRQIAWTSSELDSMQLVWGRFGTGRGSSDLLSVARLTAAENRNITVAAGEYLLYRTEMNGARVDSGLGVIGFDLNSAQAFFSSGDDELSLRVASGSLDIDFMNNKFATELSLEHALKGSIDFASGGRVASGGYLIGDNRGMNSVVGAVSSDGAEAGYFFERIFEDGTLSGLTLWGEQ